MMKRHLEEEMPTQELLEFPDTAMKSQLLSAPAGSQLYQLQEIHGKDPRFRLGEKFFGDFDFNKIKRSSKAFSLLPKENSEILHNGGDSFEKNLIADKYRTLKVLSGLVDNVVVRKRKVFKAIKRFDPNSLTKARSTEPSLVQRIKESFAPQEHKHINAVKVQNIARQKIPRVSASKKLSSKPSRTTIDHAALREVSNFKDFSLNNLNN